MYRPNILRQPVADLWIFQYGLRYLPIEGEADAYRTVKIDRLPATITMRQVLSAIPGEIYMARLLDTSRLTGSTTTIVIFVTEQDALTFLKGTSRSGLHLGLGNDNDQARAMLVNTPTYPMTREMRKLTIHEGYTRSLVVHSVRGCLTEEVSRVLMKSIYRDYVESVEDGLLAGEVYVRFHGITIAAAAFELLKIHPSFGKCKFSFLKARSERNT
jgi:hypothetical protein